MQEYTITTKEPLAVEEQLTAKEPIDKMAELENQRTRQYWTVRGTKQTLNRKTAEKIDS